MRVLVFVLMAGTVLGPLVLLVKRALLLVDLRMDRVHHGGLVHAHRVDSAIRWGIFGASCLFGLLCLGLWRLAGMVTR